MTNNRKPKILFLCDKRGWAYDTAAQNLKYHLSDQFEFEIFYVAEAPEILPGDYDLIYVFWWGEKYHRLFLKEGQKVVKEISSHRWQFEERYGRHSPEEALERYLHDAGQIVTTSQRLKKLFFGLHPFVHHYPLGVDVELFNPQGCREGSLVVGWAGNINDNTKGIKEVILPACGEDFPLQQATGGLSMAEMAKFYNGIDVICVAATAEGTPLPLLEAMACGCFPVTTDVGIVPEIIQHGKNGLIVDRTPEAFRAALLWCRDNIGVVRSAGLENAKLIQRERSWQKVSVTFAGVLKMILKEVGEKDCDDERKQPDYGAHFARINPGGVSDAAYRGNCAYIREDVEELLPANKDSIILEIGTGFGHMLRFLVEKGFRRVWGVDVANDLLDIVRSHIGDKVERLECADARDFLVGRTEKFDSVLMLDMLEHVSRKEAKSLLHSVHVSLKEGGRIIIRTPNMANLLGNYSLYMDATHMHGYTEWTLFQLLEEAGFKKAFVYTPTRFATRKRQRNAWLVKALHTFIYSITDKARPSWFGKNIVVYADKESSEDR